MYVDMCISYLLSAAATLSVLFLSCPLPSSPTLKGWFLKNIHTYTHGSVVVKEQLIVYTHTFVMHVHAHQCTIVQIVSQITSTLKKHIFFLVLI